MVYPSLLGLLVLTLSVFSVTSKCPSLEDIYPCKCQVHFITENDVLVCRNEDTTLNQLKSALSYFSKDDDISIWLENLNLGTIPYNLFEGHVVKHITINNCEIDFEDGEPPFKGLEDSLKLLLINSSLTQKNVSPNLKLGHLKNLEILELANNKIPELGDDFFADGPYSFFSIYFKNNGIEKIGEKAFENLKDFKYFTLSGNNLGSFRRNMIPASASRLEDLDIDNNGLEDLPEDLFTSMPSLTYVSLRKNKIKTLDRGTWENILEQVEQIYLEENPLQCDSEMEWLFENKMSHKFLYGTCSGPEGKEGLSLREFIRNGKE